jgi:hypothetical protein
MMNTAIYDVIPPACQDGLIRHIIHGHELGQFLEAVLANDLMNAASRADLDNQRILHIYASFLFNAAPAGSFGSPEKVAKWRRVRKDEGPLSANVVDWPNEAWEAQAKAVARNGRAR